MKWENNRQSDHVEDLRNQPGGGQRRVGGRGIGLGTLVIAVLAGWLFGINPMTILGFLGGGGGLAPDTTQSSPTPVSTEKPQDQMGQFVSSVLAGTEDVWTTVFQQSGAQYTKPRLVLFSGYTPTACGTGQAAMGRPEGLH
jgi:uncharacterized protein